MGSRKTKRIWLLLSPFSSSIRDLCRAIEMYAMRRDEWTLISVSLPCPWRANIAPAPDGIIGGLYTERALSWARSLKVPCVNLSSGSACPGLPSVWPDNEGIGRTAAHTLRQQGLTQFAWLGYRDVHFSRLRQQGFVDQLDKMGFSCSVHLLDSAVKKEGAEWKSVSKWIVKLPRPCGLFVEGDSVAWRTMRLISGIGLRIPEDISVLGIGNEESVCDFTKPPLSSIPLPGFAMGVEAAALLDRMLRGEPAPQTPILVPSPDPALRGSTRTDVALDDPVVARAIEIIRGRALDLWFNVDRLAEACGLTRRTLDRRFIKALKMTPKQMVDRIRLDNLKWRLSQTDDLNKQICSEIGFSSGFQMNRFFKRMTGMTPGAFRAEAKRSQS